MGDVEERLRKVASIALCPTAIQGERDTAAIKYFELLRTLKITELPILNLPKQEQPRVPPDLHSTWENGVVELDRNGNVIRGPRQRSNTPGSNPDLDTWRMMLQGDLAHVDSMIFHLILPRLVHSDPLRQRILQEMDLRKVDPQREERATARARQRMENVKKDDWNTSSEWYYGKSQNP